VKVGDLVKVEECRGNQDGFILCECFFCNHNSNRIGVVIEDTGAAGCLWLVQFDCGGWRVYRDEVEVINETR